jgi:integrase
MHTKFQGRYLTTASAVGGIKGLHMARRANGNGYTYKVGNSYRTVIRKNGYVITAMASSAQESRKRAREKLANFPNLGNSENQSDARKMKLGAFLLGWLNEEHQQTIAHSTFKRYRSLSLNHINPCIGDLELQKITSQHIYKVLRVMKDSGQGVRSIQQARALLSIALAAAEDKGFIGSNPVKKVKNPTGINPRFTPLTIDEVRRLLNAFAGTFMSARLHIALICGLRQGESLGLRWQDVDFEKGLLHLKTQIQLVDNRATFTNLKTVRSIRTIALTDETVQALFTHKEIVQRMREQAGETWEEWDLVFPRVIGSPRSSTVDSDEWHRCLRLCAIPRRRLHDARHTAATLMYSQGIGIETISRALGHSSSAITSRLYVHSAEEPLRVAAERMNALII